MVICLQHGARRSMVVTVQLSLSSNSRLVLPAALLLISRLDSDDAFDGDVVQPVCSIFSLLSD